MDSLKKLAMLLAIAAVVLGFATCASAQTTWTLEDVTFNDGNTAVGSFSLNAALTSSTLISLTVSGSTTTAGEARDFTANTIAVTPAGSPTQVDFAYDPGFNPYLDLYFATPLTNAGGVVQLSVGYDCISGLCGSLVTGELIGVTPEPGSMLLFGTGLLGAGFVMRRRLLV